MSGPRRVSHEGVREALRTVGPLTTRELAVFFPGSNHQAVAAVLHSMRTLVVRQVHICEWTRDNGHGRTYLRAVYALGDGVDAKRPRKLTNAERCARYRARTARPKGPSSVFSWRPA